MNVIIYTDGSARGNPGPGGFGVIVATEEKVTEYGGHEAYTTNNRMELFSVLYALRTLVCETATITVYTDSAYVTQGGTTWMHGWEKSGWMTSQKTEVLHKDLWQELLLYKKRFTIHFAHIRGHIGIPANERVDSIASAYADKTPCTLYEGARSRYGIDLSSPQVEQKKKSKTQTTKKPLYYISSISGEIATHASWDECYKRVNGVPGARYKKVFSEKERDDLLTRWKTM